MNVSLNASSLLVERDVHLYRQAYGKATIQQMSPKPSLSFLNHWCTKRKRIACMAKKMKTKFPCDKSKICVLHKLRTKDINTNSIKSHKFFFVEKNVFERGKHCFHTTTKKRFNRDITLLPGCKIIRNIYLLHDVFFLN